MKTDNELIAEFIKNDAINSPHRMDNHLLEYHTSWDWLMPVVEKIGRLHNSKFTYNPIEIAKGNFPDDDQYMNVITLPLFTPIDEAYKVVVEFIKWYNANK